MTLYYKTTTRDGRTFIRSTTHRKYTHAVCGMRTASWAGRLDLAQKEAARRLGPTEIAEAIEIPASEYRAIKKAEAEKANAAHNAYLDKLAIVPEGAKPAAISWKCEVKTACDDSWIGNAMRFATYDEAKAYGNDLYSRWTAVEQKQIVPSSDPVNYRMVEGRAVPL